MDFYCAAQKLVIEVDGGQHYEADGLLYDRYRTEVLEQYGVKVLRFSNLEVQENFPEVIFRWVSVPKDRMRKEEKKEGVL